MSRLEMRALERSQGKVDTTVPATWQANLLCASNVEPQAVRWLWDGWLARGKLHILAGEAGTGKTTLAIALAATVTIAGRWPDKTPCREPGNVLIWSSEDDPADTLVPRLIAAEADLGRVHFISGRTSNKGEREPFDPAYDMDLLRASAERLGGVSLLILDPIVSAVNGDMHRSNDVRRSLQPVVDFAEEHGTAVLGISHFTKGGAGFTSPLNRVIGSQAFGALARMVLVAARQEGTDARVLARAKANIAVDDGGFEYHIEPHTVNGHIQTTRALWGATVTGTAAEILAALEPESEGRRSELDKAKDFLLDVLSDGEVPVKTLKTDADGMGITWATTRRAADALSVRKRKDGAGGWCWSLPDDGGLGLKAIEDVQKGSKVLKSEHEHLEHLEHLPTFAPDEYRAQTEGY